jgi:predicted nucleic acid-binding protein
VKTFVDTSGLFALLDEDDEFHLRAVAWLEAIGGDRDIALVAHSYIIVETAALVHRRLGIEAVRVLMDAYVPALSMVYVDSRLHESGVTGYLSALRRGASLVDHVSFAFMRDQAVDQAFAFDQDFAEQGFTLVPPA